MLNYLRGETSVSGIWDNCAARTCNALNAGGILNSFITARTPAMVENELLMSGVNMTKHDLGRFLSVSNSITNNFEPKKQSSWK